MKNIVSSICYYGVLLAFITIFSPPVKENEYIIGEEKCFDVSSNDSDNELNTVSDTVEDLDLGDYSCEMFVGDKQLLCVTIVPSSSQKNRIAFSSSDTDIATINGIGRINALKSGNTTITVECGEKKVSFDLKVSEKIAERVDDIEIAFHKDKLKVGEIITLSAKIIPHNSLIQELVYESSDEEVVSVNSLGEILGRNVGKAIITVRAGDIIKEVEMEVVVDSIIKVDEHYMILNIGEEKQIKAQVFPAEASQTIEYLSTDSRIASVTKDGKVRGVSVGDVSVLLSNGDQTVALTVIVSTSDNTFSEIANERTTDYSAKTFYNNKVYYSSTVEKITHDMLKALYINKGHAIVKGEGYQIFIDGERILNYENELLTDIKIDTSEPEMTRFVINEGKPLCGEIVLSIANIASGYLYLYDNSTGKYERLNSDTFDNIVISRPGEYLITENKMTVSNKDIVLIISVGSMLTIILLGMFIALKKKYWFW